MNIILFTNPSARAGYDTRSIFKRSLTGLNSELSFSKTSCLTKAEEPSLSYYLTHSWRENNWIHTFPKGISYVKCNQSRPGFELKSPCPFPPTITISPRAPKSERNSTTEIWTHLLRFRSLALYTERHGNSHPFLYAYSFWWRKKVANHEYYKQWKTRIPPHPSFVSSYPTPSGVMALQNPWIWDPCSRSS